MSPAGTRFVCLLLCASLLAGTGAGCRPKATPADLDALAKQFTGHLAAGKNAEAVAMFDSAMKAALPEAKLAELWAGLKTSLGAYSSITATRRAEEGGYQVVYVTLAFAAAQIDMKVVFDAAARITGLWFGEPRAAGTGNYSPPAYVDRAKFAETETAVVNGQWRLPATLTMPVGSGPFPAVVLVHGSGPNDRNETIGPNRPFQDLAWGLASRGIAVLRYEKRTKQYQKEITDPAGFTVDMETVDDAVAAARLLQGTAKIDPGRVFIIGHSLGASMAPRIALHASAGGGRPVAGLAMLAANARDLLTLMLEQSDYLARLDGSVTQAEEAQLTVLRAGADRIRKGNLSATELVLGAGKAYWDDLLAYDPVTTARGLQMPLLLLQGERDYQVTMTDFGLWRQGLADRPAATLKSYPGLNHLFIAGEGQPNATEYQNPGNVAEAVVRDIAAWISGLAAQ